MPGSRCDGMTENSNGTQRRTITSLSFTLPPMRWVLVALGYPLHFTIYRTHIAISIKLNSMEFIQSIKTRRTLSNNCYQFISLSHDVGMATRSDSLQQCGSHSRRPFCENKQAYLQRWLCIMGKYETANHHYVRVWFREQTHMRAALLCVHAARVANWSR
jgi:hypothetical protein